MKGVLAVLFATFAISLALALDASEIEVVMDGQRVGLDADVRARAVEISVDLLSTCAFKDLHPQRTMADARKQSHVGLIFANPRTVQVPVEHITVEVREMVVTLPPTSAIWVSTDHGVIYFAKFQPAPARSLWTLLQEEQSRQPRSP